MITPNANDDEAAREVARLTQAPLARSWANISRLRLGWRTGERRVDVIEFIRLSRAEGFNAGEMLKKISELSEHVRIFRFNWAF